jgi:hypothetical protein
MGFDERRGHMMMTWRARVTSVAVIAALAGSGMASAAVADGDDARGSGNIRERLSGYEEDPAVVSTTGNGTFVARVDERNQTITYRLSYADLEGPVTQAHIHFGGKAQSGGIVVFLCANVGTPPAGTQACPDAPATITGTLTPANIIGPVGQGIEAGAWAEFVAAIRANLTYANVHSVKWPGGEIRGQIEHHH